MSSYATSDKIKAFDLRQDLMWTYFIDRKSSTWNNAKKSAIKAGYTLSTARVISQEKWFRARIQSLSELLPRAEEIILEDLMLSGDAIKDPKIRKIRSTVSMFICMTVGRKKYTKRLENHNTDNVSLIKGNELIDSLFTKTNSSLA